MSRPNVTPQLLAKYDRPGPRYTSYPTAVEFNDSYTHEHYCQGLKQTDPNEALSLYLHIPFCAARCKFCGCNVILGSRQRSVRYLDYIFKELDLLGATLEGRRSLSQYHWGGGTPTFLDIGQIRALGAKVKEHFDITRHAEVAIELDPAVTSIEQVKALREIGFNRASIGVQDLNQEVLKASGRRQTTKQVTDLFEACKYFGFDSVNLDLIYGLPYQTQDGFKETLDQVIALRPDRIAVYSFAYVPWIKKNQKRLPADKLPDRDTKFALFAAATEAFLNAGYLQIGMDHFALPQDEMGLAYTSRSLYRNFMGYTVHRAPTILGVGVSSIGAVNGAFAQNVKEMEQYENALDNGRFPIEKGYCLSQDDKIRQLVITELMCNFYLNFDMIESRFDVQFVNYFASELSKLQSEKKFLNITPKTIEITELGRLFVRNICMVFDKYLDKKNKSVGPVYSRTI